MPKNDQEIESDDESVATAEITEEQVVDEPEPQPEPQPEEVLGEGEDLTSPKKEKHKRK